MKRKRSEFDAEIDEEEEIRVRCRNGVESSETDLEIDKSIRFHR